MSDRRFAGLVSVGIILSLSCTLAARCAAEPQPTPAQVFRQIEPHGVRIKVTTKGSKFLGSGIVLRVDTNGALVLTAAHVVENEPLVIVDVDAEGQPIKRFPAFVDQVDEKRDLALLHVLGKLPRTAAPLATREPEDYDELYTVCSPIGLQRQAFIERLNTKDTISRSMPLWTVSGAIIPGMSGGGIFNAEGQLVCVVHASAAYPSESDNEEDLEAETSFGFCIPLADIRAFLKDTKL